jgi:hypothetical protein
VANLLEQLTTPEKEAIAAKVLQEKIAEGGDMSFHSFGRPMELKKEPSQQMSLEKMSEIQLGANLSQNQLIKVSSLIRKGLGPTAIAPNLKNYLTLRNSRCEEFFDMCHFETGPAVFCTDVKVL